MSLTTKSNLTLEQFIERSKRHHGNKYDYSTVVYKNNKTNVTIKCSEHGTFNQTPNRHMYGVGCPLCSKTRTDESFIERATKLYGNKYEYDMVCYVNRKTEVIVICLEHGSFLTKPESFLRGIGCVVCDNGTSKLRQERSLSYINRFKYIHGDRYDYSQVVYVNNKTKIAIGCKVHGVFHQDPGTHSKGSGCPKCAKKSRI